MYTKSYNNFTTWDAQDDFLTAWGRLIETFWVSWLQTWYWLTLWPRTYKKIVSSKIKWIHINETSIDYPDRNLMFWDNWKIYNFNSLDNTPIYTHTLWYSIDAYFELWVYWYFLCNNWSWNYNIMRETLSNIYAWTFTTVNETWNTWTVINSSIPPIIYLAWNIYIWSNNAIIKIDNTWTVTSKAYFSFNVVWLTIHQSTFMAYCQDWKVYYWNWLDSADTSFSNTSQYLWFIPAKVLQVWELDYIVSNDWQLYIWSWVTTQQITYTRYTRRWEDNSQYVKIHDFTPWRFDGKLLEVVNNKVYIAENWIYEYGNLFSWLTNWLHKSIVYNNLWTQIDDIYALKYDSKTKRLYFSYKTWSTYWVDYIDFTKQETNQYWYAITEVFSGYNEWLIAFEKKISAIRHSFSYASWDNYIKLYKRINNWSWELFQTINKATDIIDWKDLRTQKDTFLDLQFKIELYNDTKWENAPILHWLQLDYDYLNI